MHLSKSTAFEKLENTISIYNGIYYQFESIFKNHRTAIANNIKPDGPAEGFIHGSRLAYISAIDGKLHMAKMFEVSLATFDVTMANIESNNCNFYVAQVFESLETYLKDYLTLFNLKNVCLDMESETFKAERGKLKEVKFLQLIKRAIHLNSELEKSLRYDSLDYIVWSDVFRLCRHAITHSKGVINNSGDTFNFFSHFKEYVDTARKYISCYFDVDAEASYWKVNTTNSIQEIFREALRFATHFEKHLQAGGK